MRLAYVVVFESAMAMTEACGYRTEMEGVDPLVLDPADEGKEAQQEAELEELKESFKLHRRKQQVVQAWKELEEVSKERAVQQEGLAKEMLALKRDLSELIDAYAAAHGTENTTLKALATRAVVDFLDGVDITRKRP